MVVVWSANHFYYNGELFSCLLYSSLEAIFCPPVKPGVAFGPTNTKTAMRKSAWLLLFSVLRKRPAVVTVIDHQLCLTAVNTDIFTSNETGLVGTKE